MSRSESLVDRRHAVVPRGVGQFAGDLTVDRARGALLVDVDGNELLDFTGGIGVMNVGHCDERVVAAIREQAGKLLHTCFHVATYETYVALCEELVGLLPHGGPTKAMLVNSGSEAVENAVKIARQASGRQAVICFTEAFHGRTMMGMTLTSKTRYKLGCGPYAPEVYRAPYPRLFHDVSRRGEQDFVRDQLASFEELFANLVTADQVAAIIIEPVLGEGGFVPAPFGYLRGLRELCDRTGILLICDEVQSGFCRTGRWAAYEHAGIVPDLSTYAKSMGGGLPIGAVVGRAEVMDAAQPSTLGGTFGGNPVACAAALATISVMKELDLNARATQIGDVLRTRFQRLAERTSLIGDVRGLGAMIGVEFCHDRDAQRPAGDALTTITEGCRARGLVILPAGRNGNVLRVLCPLVITDDELERGISTIEQSVLALTQKTHA